MTEVFILLVLFQIKHLVADYYLQTPYMYLNKGSKDNWKSPLFLHSVIHGEGTYIIATVFIIVGNNLEGINIMYGVIYALMLSVFDITTHFLIDRWKAKQKLETTDSQFWINLGIDQMLHHLVGIFIVFAIVTC